MNDVSTITRYTPDDLLRMPDGDHYELVDGRLVETNMSVWSSYVAANVYFLLRTYCQAAKLGWVFSEGTSYRCFPEDPNRVRKADVSYLRGDRITKETAMSAAFIHIVPDLVVEVLSPNDLAYEVDTKLEEYRRADVRLIWIVNPEARTVRIEQASGAGTVLHDDAELDGGDVIPGFHCRISEFFVPPPSVVPNT